VDRLAEDGRQDVVAVDGRNIWCLRGPFIESGKRGRATDLDPNDGVVDMFRCVRPAGRGAGGGPGR
jgi:hypothetical protein